MADQRDVELTKLVRREFNRHQLDLSLLEIHVSHGVAYIRGSIGAAASVPGGGAKEETRHTVDQICHHLRTIPDIRDVILDATFL